MVLLLVKLLRVVVTDVIIMNLEANRLSQTIFFIIKHGWKLVLSLLRTEVNKVVFWRSKL